MKAKLMLFTRGSCPIAYSFPKNKIRYIRLVVEVVSVRQRIGGDHRRNIRKPKINLL